MSDANPVVGIMDEEIDFVRKANSRADAAEVRAKDLETQCAAMREALQSVAVNTCEACVCRDIKCECDCSDRLRYESARAALSGDAGRALLERVEAQDRRIAALESVAKAAREFRNAVAPMDYDAAAKALDYHLDALSYLDALEPKR